MQLLIVRVPHAQLEARVPPLLSALPPLPPRRSPATSPPPPCMSAGMFSRVQGCLPWRRVGGAGRLEPSGPVSLLGAGWECLCLSRACRPPGPSLGPRVGDVSWRAIRMRNHTRPWRPSAACGLWGDRTLDRLGSIRLSSWALRCA